MVPSLVKEIMELFFAKKTNISIVEKLVIFSYEKIKKSLMQSYE